MMVQDSTVVTALTSADQMRARILELQEALQKQLPQYESIVHTIHVNLAKDPDTVHLLSEKDIGVICAALSKKTGVMIAKEIEAKAAKKVKSGKTTLEDL